MHKHSRRVSLPTCHPNRPCEHRRYVDQLRIYERQTANAGLSKLHGLRHLYAQERHQELTESLARQQLLAAGWTAPSCGGPCVTDLTQAQKAIDRETRLIISHELGHEREQIAAIYLGRCALARRVATASTQSDFQIAAPEQR